MCFVLVYCCVGMTMASCCGGTKPILGRKRITLPVPKLSPTRWNSLRLWPSLRRPQIKQYTASNEGLQNNYAPEGRFEDTITVEDRVSDSFCYIFLKRYCTKFGEKFRVWPKEVPKRFPKLVISIPCVKNVNYVVKFIDRIHSELCLSSISFYLELFRLLASCTMLL